MKKIHADLGLLLIGVLWGLGFIVTKIGLNEGVGPLYLLMLRFIIATIFFAIVFHKHILNITLKDIQKMFLISIILFLAYAFQIIGSKYTTASKAAFYTGLNVIFVPYISWTLNRKVPGINTYIASIICLVGIGFISYNTQENIFILNIGDVLVIISAIFFGAHIALTGYYSKKYYIEKILFIQNSIAAFLFTIVFLISLNIPILEERFIMFSNTSLLSILYLGLISTGLCLFLQAYFQRYTSSVKAAILLSTESIFAPFFAFIILGEILTRNIVLGAVCIIIAVVLTEIKFNIKKRS